MKAGWREIDESANKALAAHFDRCGWMPTEVRMPFMDLVESENEGGATTEGEPELAPPGEYEIRQRMVGVKIFFKYLSAGGIHPANMLRQLAAMGRAMHLEPWCSLTMTEQGLLDMQTKAAHSWRCKVLSGEIKLSGQRGTRLPGQKSEDASETYKKIRMGNTNRADGEKRKRRGGSGSLSEGRDS